MPIEPATNATRIATSDILSMFLRNYERVDGPVATLCDKIYGCGLTPVSASQLHGMLSSSSDVEMRDNHQFLFLEPIESEKILPLVTLHSSNDWVHFRIYTLFTMLDKCSTLQVLAIRFETDEGYRNSGSESGSHDNSGGEPGSHDFCHAQLCNFINNRIPISTPTWIPDSQPSIPLDADNQISLVLCMLTSLYGGAHVRKRISASGDIGIRKHLKKVQALRASTTTKQSLKQRQTRGVPGI